MRVGGQLDPKPQTNGDIYRASVAYRFWGRVSWGFVFVESETIS